MQYLITIILWILLSLTLFFIIASIIKTPTLRADRILLTMKKKKKNNLQLNLETITMHLALSLARILPMEEQSEKSRQGLLNAAGILLSAKVYTAKALVNAVFAAIIAIPSTLVSPLFIVLVFIFPIIAYQKEIGRAEQIIKERKENIESELPRFVATIAQELMSSRDVLGILREHSAHSGKILSEQLKITLADMETGNYEIALMRFEARINSPLLSDVVRGLISVLRGDDSVMYFKMLAHDMKQLELSQLKKQALKRPAKINMCSMLLLICILIMYFGVLGYELFTSSKAFI